ncbi:Chorismate mutase 3 [Arabidopsis thaliana]
MEAKLLKPAFYNSPNLNLTNSSRLISRLSIWNDKSKVGLSSGSLFLRLSAASPIRYSRGLLRVDESEYLKLESIRHSLIRQEDSIIFNLLERAQYRYNADTYDEDAFTMEGFQGSLVEFMVRETEKLHAKVETLSAIVVDRYKSPDEHPFFPQCLPEPILPPIQYPQILSKRIHFGKFVAEAKFRENPAAYETAIKEQDRTQLMQLLTYETVEEVVKKRVEIKARIFGQDITINDPETEADPSYKIQPSLVAKLYGERIMPLTKEVQIEYLLRRLD